MGFCYFLTHLHDTLKGVTNVLLKGTCRPEQGQRVWHLSNTQRVWRLSVAQRVWHLSVAQRGFVQWLSRPQSPSKQGSGLQRVELWGLEQHLTSTLGGGWRKCGCGSFPSHPTYLSLSHFAYIDLKFWATSATYITAHSNTGSWTYWARPGIKPSSSRY